MLHDMVTREFFVVCGGLLIGIATGCAAPSLSVVTVPVADVRARPGFPPAPGSHDPLQETQLLYGERVKVLTTDGPWAFIEAVEQAEYTHAHAWHGYPGWVRQDDLRPLPASGSPQAVVSAKWATLWAEASASTALMQVPMGTKLTPVRT